MPRIFPLSIIFLAIPQGAYACGACAAAALWSFYPPLLFWPLIFVFWFLGWSILGTVTGRRIAPIPSIGVTLLLFALLIVVVAPAAGPLTAFLLVPFLVMAWVRFARSGDTQTPLKFRRWVHGISAIALVFMLVISVVEAISPTPHEPIDVIRQWPGTGPSRAALNRIADSGDGSSELLRQIIRGSPVEFSPFEASRAAQELEKRHEPEVDVPLLIDAYARVYKPDSTPGGASDSLHEALVSYTGLDLPEDSGPEAWREAWENRALETKTELH